MGKHLTVSERRVARVRRSLKKVANGRPRLSVHRTGKHIYAQIIDDKDSRTVASASSMEKDIRGKLSTGGNKDAAAEIGKLIAKRAGDAGVTDVVFDRGGFLFHGRVKALADAAREGGLNF
jgi:large subunit ribosomal protein L18